MDEESKQYMAFMLGSMGLYECESMPFGLCNAPPTFQRLMLNCLGELNLTYCLIYLDDVIVFSQTEEEHLERMHVVFDRLCEHGLKLKPSKCDVFKTEINYLAHHVSKKGVLPSKKNLEAIAECPPPDTYTKVKSFIGLGHKLVCPRLLRVLQTKLRMRSLILSQTCLTLSQRGCSPVATWPLGSTICEASQMATRVWGAASHLSIGLIPNVPIGICNEGGKTV